MVLPLEVTLDVATPSDDVLLSNLLELYMHDLSAAFPDVELGPDGRFGYNKLPLYWSEPDRRFAFLIKCDGRVAGFALATRGSPATEDPDVLDVAGSSSFGDTDDRASADKRHSFSGTVSPADGPFACLRGTRVPFRSGPVSSPISRAAP